MVNQYLTFLRSVGLTTLAAMLSWALLVDALELLGGKPPHHGKVSFNRGGLLWCFITGVVYWNLPKSLQVVGLFDDDLPDSRLSHEKKRSSKQFQLRFPARHKKLVKLNKNQSIISIKINLMFQEKKVTTYCSDDRTVGWAPRDTKDCLSDTTWVISKLIGLV